ncbi:MAG: DUF58 domain-containing protein [Planctomycetota bacterium]
MSPSRSSSLLEPALLERLKGLTLVARRVVEGALHGLHQSSLHGLSIEFAQHRAYSPGDELKHLDWRVLGRSDRYVIKQYQQETNLRAVIFVDCSKSMAYGARVATTRRDTPPLPADTDTSTLEALTDTSSKFHYARRLAAALAYLMLHQGDSVGLVLSNYRIIEQVAPRAAPGHIVSICQALERAAPDGITDVSGVLGQLATRLRRRSLLILISDLLDNPESILQTLGQLHHRGHEVLVLQVLDRRELDFDLGLAGSGVTVIRDMETHEEFEAEPALVRELVRAEVARFCQALDSGARRHGIDLLRYRTDQPLERILIDYLHARLKGRGRLAATRQNAHYEQARDS